MRIGMMLRALDEKGGIGVYTRYLTQELLDVDPHNEYIFYHRTAANLGRFVHCDNVTERVIQAPNKAFWDQISIPFACWRDKVDVLFHPKFTVPLLTPCKSVMVLHGAGWFMPHSNKYWTALDLRYIRTVMPLYCKKASAIISVSQLTTDTFNRVFKLPPGKVKTVYFGPGKHFKRVENKGTLQQVKAKYNLPDKFILTLTKRDGDGRKNLGQIFKAYARYHGRAPTPHKLVIGGKDCHLFRAEYGLPKDGYGQDILFPGWIEQEELPAVYSLADLYLYPSNLEAFPIPITEAMACGTPIVTSNVNGLKEIAGDAALLVDPSDTESISEAICRVLSDSNLRTTLSSKGLARSSNFTWEACAKKTLALLESLMLG
jgi:glycosyltransferase involved in cell wall biosynthesis